MTPVTLIGTQRSWNHSTESENTSTAVSVWTKGTCRKYFSMICFHTGSCNRCKNLRLKHEITDVRLCWHYLDDLITIDARTYWSVATSRVNSEATPDFQKNSGLARCGCCTSISCSVRTAWPACGTTLYSKMQTVYWLLRTSQCLNTLQLHWVYS